MVTQEECLAYMNSPLSESERKFLTDAGWEFVNDTYMHIPNDYDGCMAEGISMIRNVLLQNKYPTIYWKHKGRCKEILEEILNK